MTELDMNPLPRQTPSNETDTFAYAVSFHEAARMVSASEEVWDDNSPMVVPFYMLIGFSLENCLKAVLEHRAVDKAGNNWSHSHDLAKLKDLAIGTGFSISAEISEFVDHLSPLHKQHQFRYPQKASRVRLLQPEPALQITLELLTGAFSFIGGPSRMTGN